ncbi:MAG TPA: ABC transporter permease subunit [Methanocella sp.]|nr:ABC transporter permease subunit [Methanocella sp.]
MTLNILKQTLLDRWKSIGLVTGLIFVFMAYYTTVYPATAALDMSQSLGDILNSPAVKLLLGNLQVNNSFESFLSIKALVFIAWIATGFMAWLAAGFLSGEIDHKTIDLLLAQPVRRGSLVVTRYAALVLTAVLIMAGALVGTVLAGEGDG